MKRTNHEDNDPEALRERAARIQAQADRFYREHGRIAYTLQDEAAELRRRANAVEAERAVHAQRYRDAKLAIHVAMRRAGVGR